MTGVGGEVMGLVVGLAGSPPQPIENAAMAAIKVDPKSFFMIHSFNMGRKNTHIRGRIHIRASSSEELIPGDATLFPEVSDFEI
jgi:hypothetical protein